MTRPVRRKRTSGRASRQQIDSARHLKVLSNPLRMRMLELLAEDSHSVKELAQRLKEPKTKLYRHIELMLSAGFVKVVKTRQVSGIREAIYGLGKLDLGLRVSVPPSQLKSTELQLRNALRENFGRALNEIDQGLKDGRIDLSGKSKTAATMAAINGMLLMSDKDTEKLLAELQKLLKKLGTGKKKPKAKRYGFLFALYPTLEIEKKGGGK